MATLSTRQNILIKYSIWYFFDVPREILLGWKNFLVFNFNYFSVFLLLKTFFSPWREYRWSYGRGFDVGRYFEAFFSNLVSRILGAIMRSILIIFGIFTEIFIFICGAILFFGWLLVPIFIFLGLRFSFKILF